jgi:uncharacterized protein (TIGR03437 family)
MSFYLRSALVPGLLAVCSLPAYGAVRDRILSKPDARLTALKGQRRPEAIAPNDQGPVDPALRIDYATLYLKPAPGLEAFLADQQNPSSPDYHRWLTPEQFGERFGVSANDATQIVSWLQSQGLTVHDIARGRHWITFSGTATRVAKAFYTEFHRYRINNVLHYANSTEISLPAAFEPVVRAVDGLNDFALDAMHRASPPVSLKPNLNNSTGKHYLAPDDLATIYNIAPLYAAKTDGTGQKVAIIGRTSINLSDLRNFRTYFNLPPGDPQLLLYGPDPGVRPADLVEADLDLEWAGAIARNATIIYVYSTSVNVSAQYAVDQNVAPVMSMSYGGCELTLFDTLRPVAQQAAAQGITWAIASGDSGATTCDRSAPTPQATKGATVAYPASIPEVTAVGGTQLDDSSGVFWSPGNSLARASALSYIPEKVWNQSIENNAIEGGGGGASAMFTKPGWQLGPGVPNDGRRDLPDISFASATYIGYVVFSNDTSYIVGGTSAASPVFAGMVALLNQSLAAKDPRAPVGLGNINPALYRLARSNPGIFHDITVGDNAMPCMQGTPDCVNGRVGFAAQPGYDLAAGLGSLDVTRFVSEWSVGTASSTTISGSPDSYGPNDKVLLTATVTGAAQPPTGTVTFVGNDTALGTVVLSPGATSSTATLSVNGILLAGGNGTVGALYSGDATFTASWGSAVLTLKIPAAGSLVLPSVSPNPVRQSGTSWPYTLQITEKAGVPSRITVFTVNNVDNLRALPDPNVAANSTNYLQLSGNNLNVPLDRVYHFEGVDASGATWVRELSVPFVGSDSNRIVPAISLTVSPSTIQQNPNADPTCQWSQQVTVQESTGFHVNLATFTAGGVSQTSRISQLFGATRLAPFGVLSATLCSSGVSAPSVRTYSVSGTSELNTTVTASASATFSEPAASAAAFTVSQPSINIAGSASLDLNFASGSPAWAASVFPFGQKWLTLSSASGTGNVTLNLAASAAGLSNGVYSAVLNLQALNTIPQLIQVPVTFVVGQSGSTTINGIGNAASGDRVFAPGQLIAVYGANLAPSTLSATVQPLPLQLAGVSATVNGVSTPLWFISPGQINLQIPYEVSAGSAVLGVNNNGQVSSFRFPVSPAAPGIFAYQGALVPVATATPGQTIFGFVTGDGDVTPTLPSGASPASGTSLSRLPQPRQPIGITVGGRAATVVFSGIVPGLVGVTQVNFTVPADLDPGIQPVVAKVGGVSGTPVNLTVNPLPN